MRVLHITKTRSGGAGAAAARSVSALQKAGAAAELLTEGSSGFGPGSTTWSRWILDRLDSAPTRFHFRRRKFSSWSNNWRHTHLASAINARAPDVVHLHWTAQGFLSLDEISRIRAPIVWTMHDMWPITGGCHYAGQCRRFADGCGSCPQLGSMQTNDLSAQNWRGKSTALRQIRRWISPSRWLAGCALSSPWIPSERLCVIPNALDLTDWSPTPRSVAREQLGLSEHTLVFVTGAMDLREPRKGCRLLIEALTSIVAAERRPIVLLLFGGGQLSAPHVPQVEFRPYGRLKRPADLTTLYSAADAMLMTSLQDNLPYVVMEAQACGCPVVGFDTGGVGEIVETGRTGLLTPGLTAADLASVIRRWNESNRPRVEVATAARERMLSLYSPQRHASSLLCEYERVLIGTAALQ